MDYRSFYLIKRRLPSGRRIYYFYYRQPDGRRSVPHTTGKSTKNSAWLYCESLQQKETADIRSITFGAFAGEFFSENGRWYKDACLNGACTKSTRYYYANTLQNNILPYFGALRLRSISAADVRRWRLWLSERRLSAATINNSQKILSKIFSWAVDESYIRRNPVSVLRPVRSSAACKEAFTREEVRLIVHNLAGRNDVQLFALTAACTGLRCGELLGLRPGDLRRVPFPHLVVERQVNRFGVGVPKNKKSRQVPLPDKLFERLAACSGAPYIFASPVKPGQPFAAAGITKKIMEAYRNVYPAEHERNVSFHSFRHFFNTYLTSCDINSRKIKAVMGHSGGKSDMTEIYTTWHIGMFAEIFAAQNRLLEYIVPPDNRPLAADLPLADPPLANLPAVDLPLAKTQSAKRLSPS